MATISDMEDSRDLTPSPEEGGDLEWEFDPDTAINLLNDCKEHLDHLQMLDAKGNFLTRNRRLSLVGLIEELEAFLAG